jgi:hypothetical protein
MCDHPERYRQFWADEDATLEVSEAAVASGEVSIEEVPALDLAVVTVPTDAPTGGGHRFASQWEAGLHPMAVNNATRMLSVITVLGASCQFAYRYESWVQYRTRRPRPRVDLAPLADALNGEELSGGRWIAEASGGLTPRLYLSEAEQTSLGPAEFTSRVRDHLTNAPPAWDPYPS